MIENEAFESRGEEERPVAVQLAAIFGSFAANREEDWRQLRLSPLSAGIEDLTSRHGPLALEPAQAQFLRETIATFRELYPNQFEQLRLCGFGHGLEVIVGKLATADLSGTARREDACARGAEVRRYFAEENQGTVRPYRPSIRRDTTWVV